MKLVPNMDQHNWLMNRMTLDGGPDGNAGLESGVEYDMKALGEQGQYYEWNGAKRLNFPRF